MNIYYLKMFVAEFLAYHEYVCQNLILSIKFT